MASSVITIRDADVKRAARVLGQKAPFAFVKSINRALVSGRTVMVKLVSADTGLNQADVQKEIHITNARPNAVGSASGRITSRGYRIPLIKFAARGQAPSRGKGPGVTAGVRGGRKRYPNAFIATMSNGHRGVFKRDEKRPMGKQSPGAWGPNLPIVELHGPSVAHVFDKHHAAGIAAGEAMLTKTLAHEIERAIAQSSVT